MLFKCEKFLSCDGKRFSAFHSILGLKLSLQLENRVDSTPKTPWGKVWVREIQAGGSRYLLPTCLRAGTQLLPGTTVLTLSVYLLVAHDLCYTGPS